MARSHQSDPRLLLGSLLRRIEAHPPGPVRAYELMDNGLVAQGVRRVDVLDDDRLCLVLESRQRMKQSRTDLGGELGVVDCVDCAFVGRQGRIDHCKSGMWSAVL